MLNGTKQLRAPNGCRIKGTSDTLPATALVSGWTQEEGKIVPDYTGETEVHWDGQTENNIPDSEGDYYVVAEDGTEWPLSACILE